MGSKSPEFGEVTQKSAITTKLYEIRCQLLLGSRILSSIGANIGDLE